MNCREVILSDFVQSVEFVVINMVRTPQKAFTENASSNASGEEKRLKGSSREEEP
jgi:hypothetical protein